MKEFLDKWTEFLDAEERLLAEQVDIPDIGSSVPSLGDISTQRWGENSRQWRDREGRQQARQGRSDTRQSNRMGRLSDRIETRDDRAQRRQDTIQQQDDNLAARQQRQSNKQTARTLDQATRRASRVSPQGYTLRTGTGTITRPDDGAATWERGDATRLGRNQEHRYSDRELEFMAANPQFDYTGDRTADDRGRMDAAPLRSEFGSGRQGRQDYRRASSAWDTYQHNVDYANRRGQADQIQQHAGLMQGLAGLDSYSQEDVAGAMATGDAFGQVSAPYQPPPFVPPEHRRGYAQQMVPDISSGRPGQLDIMTGQYMQNNPDYFGYGSLLRPPPGTAQNPIPPPDPNAQVIQGDYQDYYEDDPRFTAPYRRPTPSRIEEARGMKRHINAWDSFLDKDILMEQNINIDISSFKAQGQLEPNVWTPSKTLDPKVRQRLITIAKKFWLSLNLPSVNIEDITFTGSLANYNWSKYSDVDLHILVDFTQLPGDNEIVEALMTAKRASWNRRHDITIHGYEVEIYVQDSNEVHHSTGVYSVLNDRWLVEPHKKRFTIDRENVTVKATHIMKQIDKIAEDFESGNYKKSMADVDRLKEKIRKFRKCGLEQSGEYSSENIAFKALRRNGYLEKLSNLKVDSYDKIMSL